LNSWFIILPQEWALIMKKETIAFIATSGHAVQLHFLTQHSVNNADNSP